MDCTELPGHSITPECSAIEHSIEHSPTMRSVADLMAEGQSLSLSAHASMCQGMILLPSLLWTELCSPKVTAFGDMAFMEVSKVEWSHKAGT